MARQIEEFPWDKVGAQRGPKYPWDKYLNGKPWELTIGKDFTSKVGTFITAGRKAAVRNGGVLHWARNGDKTIVITFVPNKPRSNDGDQA